MKLLRPIHAKLVVSFLALLIFSSVSTHANAEIYFPAFCYQAPTNLQDRDGDSYYESFSIYFLGYLYWSVSSFNGYWVIYCEETGDPVMVPIYNMTGSGEGWALQYNLTQQDLSVRGPLNQLTFYSWIEDQSGNAVNPYVPDQQCAYPLVIPLKVEPPLPVIKDAYIATEPSACIDRDHDGYLDEFGLYVFIDAVSGNAATDTVDALVTCTNTGQSWWVGPWPITDSTGSNYTGIYLDNTDFNLTGPTALNFKLDLYSQDHRTLYQTFYNLRGAPSVEPPIPYIQSSQVESLALGRDINGNGYYDTYSFSIHTKIGLANGSKSVKVRTTCTTTGQVWTSNALSAPRDLYSPFSYSYFQLSGPSLLNFKVELLDANTNQVYSTVNPVGNGNIKADPALSYVSAEWAELTGLMDPDQDGYYEEYNLNFNIAANNPNCARQVYATITCTTTNQSWTTGPWQTSGTGWILPQTLTLTQLDIANLTSKASLSFRVDVYDMSYNRLCDSGSYTFNNLVQVEVSGNRVFKPNPVNKLNNSTLTSYNDEFSDVPYQAYDNVSLSNLCLPVNGVYSLSGSYARIIDLPTYFITENDQQIDIFAPHIQPVTSNNGQFPFYRQENGFEEVMAYYHITLNQNYLHTLGFLNIRNGVIDIDAHGYNGKDNSCYIPIPALGYGYGSGVLIFGSGPDANDVDDAEDADVILHEYGHAIQDSQTKGIYFGDGDLGYGNETPAMGEGFGDYWAASCTYDWSEQSGYDPAIVFEWDGSKNPALLTRRVDYSCKSAEGHYPDGMSLEIMPDKEEDVHISGRIWSSALWDLFNKFGKQTADTLILTSHKNIYTKSLTVPANTPFPTFSDGANAIIQAAGPLNLDKQAIADIFKSRGIEVTYDASLASFSPDILSPTKEGNTIHWTATGTGGTGQYEYKFVVENSANQIIFTQGYSSTNTFSWTPSRGNYTVTAYIRNAGTNPDYVDDRDIDYTVVTPVSLVSVTPSHTSPSTIDYPITWTVTASGGTAAASGTTGTNQYQFEITDPSTGQKSIARAYSTDNTWKWKPTATGTYTTTATVNDTGCNPANSNVATQSISHTVNPDATPPRSSISAPANNSCIKNTAYTITGTANDGDGSGVQYVQVSINGGDWQNALNAAAIGSDPWSSWSYNWNNTTEGTFHIESRAVDIFNNVETTTGYIVVTADGSPPVSTINIPSNAYVNGSTYYVNGNACSITGTASDTKSGVRKVEVKIVNAATSATIVDWTQVSGTNSWSYSWTLPADGKYNIKSRATDNAGNVEMPGTGINLNVDNTAPTVSITNPTGTRYTILGTSTTNNQAIGGTSYTITGTASDGTGSGVQSVYVSTNPGNTVWVPVSTGTNNWSYTWTLPADGNYTVKAKAVDNINNMGQPTSGTAVLVDNTPPSATITAPTNNTKLTGMSYTIQGTTADTGSGVSKVEISVDGGKSWNLVKQLSVLASWSYIWSLPCDGAYNILSRVTDYAGNVTTPTVAVTVDTAPVCAITSPANNSYINLGQTCVVTATASDGTGSISGVQVYTGYNWYNATYKGNNTWSFSWTIGTLITNLGKRTLQAKATDNSGIPTTSSITLNVVSDSTAPTSTITSITTNSAKTIDTIKGTTTDGTGSGVQKVEVGITPSGGSTTWYLATGTTSWTYTWVLPIKGTFTIKSRATDNVSNVGTPSASNNVTITAYGNPELEHYNWNTPAATGGCNSCHTNLNANGTAASSPTNTFLSATSYRKKQSFCYSCHNAGGVAHENTLSGLQHSTMVNVTTSTNGDKKPTYGNITAGETNNKMVSRLKNGKKVVCMTCHNTMKKSEDYGRVWENTSTTDHKTYKLVRKGWNIYGSLALKVYSSTGPLTVPTYSKTRKSYLVDPSQYAYTEVSGLIKFNTAKSSSRYFYVTLDYPDLRVSSQNNNICADCHTQQTHKSNNCFVCHSAHNNSSNIVDVRSQVRIPTHTARSVIFKRYTGVNSFADGNSPYSGVCYVCHTQTKYYRYDGSGAPNHADGINYNGKNCINCHSHTNGFASSQIGLSDIGIIDTDPEPDAPATDPDTGLPFINYSGLQPAPLTNNSIP
jgi:predicted CXXCH cytochrome family protein